MSGSRNLSEVSITELKKFLRSFDTVLCDCDGVLFLLKTAIEGTPEVLAKLKLLGKRVYYVTNNCSKTRKNFAEFLQEICFNLEEEEVIMPTIAIIGYLKGINFDKKLFVVSLGGLKQELRDAGFRLIDTGPSEVPEETMAIINAISNSDPDVGAVILDTDMNVNYLKLQKAVFYLNDPEVHFITGGQDSILTVGGDLHLIGPIHFHNAVKAVSGRNPMVFGKPSQNLTKIVNRTFNINPRRTLFIGDTFNDMLFADNGGYQKMLVLSGVTTAEDLKNCNNPKILPQYYLNSLGDLNPLLDQISKTVPSML